MKNIRTDLKKKTIIIKFLFLAYGISWLAWLPAILASHEIISEIPWPPLFAIGVCGPLIAALICIYQENGWSAVRRWFRNGFSHQINGFWWCVILVIPFLVPALALWIYRIFDGEMVDLKVVQQPWIILPAILLMVTIGGGQEEYGWRGFLLPRLDEFLPVWQTNLLMIPLHACWHLPLFIITYTMQSQYSFWLFLIFGIGFTPLINRVFRSTGGSFIAAILFHGLTNAGLDVFPPVGPYVNHSPIPLLIITTLLITSNLLLIGKNTWKRSSSYANQKGI